MKRVCKKCDLTKPVAPEYFQRDSTRPNGFDTTCKVCRKAYRQANKDKSTARAREWRKTHSDWTQKNRTRMASIAAFPERKKCVIENCEAIGQIHHIDYGDPLAVLWLCQNHHAMVHTLERIAS